MPTALIQFTQGATVGVAGEALFGVAGAAVDVANAVNTGVTSWQIELVDVPPTSALTTGVKASSDNGSTPAYSFTPDVAGGYRLVLKVWDAINRVGTATDTDIRNFGVKGAGGFYRPTQQIWPRPLPPVASGEAGAKPDENNFAGQTRGWAGTGSDGLLANLIDRVEAGAQTQSWRMLAAPATTAARYMPLASAAGSATESVSVVLWALPARRATTIRAFHTLPPVADSITYTLRVNGVDTGLVVVMGPGVTSNSATADIAIATGDVLTMKAVQSSTEPVGSLGAAVAVVLQ